MKNIILVAAALFAAGNAAYACDVCGAGAGGQYIGLLPAFSRNFAGIQYLRSDMYGAFASAYKGRPDEHTHDVFHTLQVWGRYRIGRYQVFAFVPYRYNVRRSTETGDLASSGMGDVSLLLNRVFVERQQGRVRHTLFGGLGAKLPTGHYTSIMGAGNVQAMSPGTGSWDVLANANYTLLRGNSGMNADVSGTLTTTSPGGYRYGSRVGMGVSVFRAYTVGQVRISPQVGVRYEYAQADEYEHYKGWVNTASGGDILFASTGAQVAYRQHGIRAMCLAPVYAHYAGGDIRPNYRTETGYFILF
ncbi:hypothetical protein GCM10023093_27270 [Nemorincola caseinilytica]|uniref:Transporter n=1 Tax=Nemorincola caseinilytica TaxID=2054315 RepID=A0ABP8NNL2_9BACT